MWRLLVILFFCICTPPVYSQVDAGYEANKGSSIQCPNATGADAYGGSGDGFAICNCTSYVAYRLRLNNVTHGSGNNTLFVNHGWGGSNIWWSDAWKWGDDTKLQTVGVRKDQYPAVGSVAYWDTSKVADTGHVAYVQHLFTNPEDGRLTGIGIMEYNWADCKGCAPDRKYRYRRIGTGRKFPTAFLHFEEKGTDAGSTNATCVTVPKRPGNAHAGTFCWKHNGSNAACGNASSYHFYDYRSCQAISVTSSTTPASGEYCAQAETGAYPGYTARISGTNFPESIAPSANGTDFASCAGNIAVGNSREVSGRNLAQRAKLWRGLDNALN